jgi:hypothetical protein
MKVKCDTMLTMMKTLMTVDFFEGNEPLFAPNVLRPKDITDQEVMASMMVWCYNMCTMLIKCCGILSFNECTHHLN